jgi:hypothetical protein
MITDHYSGAVKRRAQETTTVQDTPQDIERMKIAVAARGILTKTTIRNAKTCENKAIIQENYDRDPKEPIEDYDYDVATCRSLRSKFRHHFTSPGACIAEWKDLLLGYTQDGKNYKKKLWDTPVLPPYATCTAHEILWRTMQGLLGGDNFESACLSHKGMPE